MLPAAVIDSIAELCTRSHGTLRLVESKHENLANHLSEVLLDGSKVLRANFVHQGKLFQDFTLTMGALFFTHL